MGQAKKRGTREERIEQAKVRIDAERRDRELMRVVEATTGRRASIVRTESTPSGRHSRLFALLAASALGGRK